MVAWCPAIKETSNLCQTFRYPPPFIHYDAVQTKYTLEALRKTLKYYNKLFTHIIHMGK